MSTINDPRILNAYIAITEDEPTDWLLLGYKDTRDVISLYSYGEHGLNEFRENITNEILFGFIRIEGKFLLISYIPDSISGVRRARALVHSRSVAELFKLAHSQMTASNLSDLSDNNLRTRLKLEQSRRSITPIQNHRRKSTQNFGQQQRYYSTSPLPNITTPTFDDDYDSYSDRFTNPTSTPSTPTSSVHNENPYILDQPYLIEEPTRLQDLAESMLQSQLAKKKELEEARFKLFQKEQKSNNLMKRMEEEQKRLQKKQESTTLPKWQLELQQRKLQKKQNSTHFIDSNKSSSIDPIKPPALLFSLKKTNYLPDTQKSSTFLKPELKSISNQPTKPIEPSTIQLGKFNHPSSTFLKPELSIITKHHLNNPSNLKETSLIKIPDQPSLIKIPDQPSLIKIPDQPSFTKVEKLSESIPSVPLKKVPSFTHETRVSETQVLPIAPVEKKVPTILLTGFVSLQINQIPFWKRRFYVLNQETLVFYKDEGSKTILYQINMNQIKRISLIDEDEEAFVPNSFMLETDELYQILTDDKKQFKLLYSTLKNM